MSRPRPSIVRLLRRLGPLALGALASAAGRAEEPAPVVLPDQTTSIREPFLDGPFDRTRYTPPSASHYNYRTPEPAGAALVFLPPDPPPLGSPVPLRNPLDTGVAPPAELAAHVSDLFYPQLVARLAEDTLTQRQRLRLDAYRTLKTALQEELRAFLAAAPNDPATRPAALANFARRQDARLAELESTAEQLRIDLGPRRADWRPTPPRHPPPATPEYSRWLRMTACQAEGLSTEQRRLLLSLATERSLTPAATDQPYFFAPEGTCLRLPESVRTALAGDLADYSAARRALATALLAQLDRPRPDDADELQQLATRQAPAFAALETQAAALRQALRATPGLDGQPAAPALPPELSTRLDAYRARKHALLRQLNATLNRTVRDAAAATPRGLAVPVSAFTEEQQTEIAFLDREKNELRLALAAHHRATQPVTDRKSVDTLLEDFERARQNQELREKYRDYRAALFEPGLSAAQRRLLLDAAMQALALPLPSGEMIHRP